MGYSRPQGMPAYPRNPTPCLTVCAQAQEASQPHPNPTPRNPNPTPRKPRNPTPHFRKCGAVFRAWPGATRAIIFCHFPALQATNFRVQSLLSDDHIFGVSFPAQSTSQARSTSYTRRRHPTQHTQSLTAARSRASASNLKFSSAPHRHPQA